MSIDAELYKAMMRVKEVGKKYSKETKELISNFKKVVEEAVWKNILWANEVTGKVTPSDVVVAVELTIETLTKTLNDMEFKAHLIEAILLRQAKEWRKDA